MAAHQIKSQEGDSLQAINIDSSRAKAAIQRDQNPADDCQLSLTNTLKKRSTTKTTRTFEPKIQSFNRVAYGSHE